MNELIRKCERESHIDVYGLGLDRVKWEAALEKFAELIVKDCADMVKDAHKSGGGTYLHVLYERYGIEYPWVK
jgi:uncharacterized protein YkwD